MAVKEIRRSIAILEASPNGSGVDHGLIRDVLLNPETYKEFLVESYNSAWEDGIITEEELAELKSFQIALGISDSEAAEMNVKAAIKAAAKDGEISKEESESIKKAAVESELDDDDVKKAIDDALEKN
jgi:tellurite resistance protein